VLEIIEILLRLLKKISSLRWRMAPCRSSYVLINSVRTSNPVSQGRSSRRIPNSRNERFSGEYFQRFFRIDRNISLPVGKDSGMRPRLRPRPRLCAYVLAGKRASEKQEASPALSDVGQIPPS